MTLLYDPHQNGTVELANSPFRRHTGAAFPLTPGWLTVERGLCLVVLFLIGWAHEFHLQLTVGGVAALLLCPIWIGTVRRYRFGSVFFIVGCVTYLAGLFLTMLSKSEHRYYSVTSVLHDSGLWIGTLAAIGLVLWARTIMGIGYIGVAYGLGMLLGSVLNPGVLGPTNPWKFVYAVPVIIICIALTSNRSRRMATLVVLLCLSGVCALLDARSLFGTLLLAAVLVGWQLRPRSKSRPMAWGWTLVLLGGLAGAVYNLATSLMLDGYFGAETQQRSHLQVQTAGSLILGGRPELAASLGLFRHDPLGFGVGVSPNIFDVMVAKAAMIKINYDPENGYVERYMFGGQVELHSTTGDLWATFGPVGLVMAAVIMVLCVRGLAASMSDRAGNGLLIFLVCYTFWNLAFSPLYSAIPTLILTIGLSLGLRVTSSGEPGVCR